MELRFSKMEATEAQRQSATPAPRPRAGRQLPGSAVALRGAPGVALHTHRRGVQSPRPQFFCQPETALNCNIDLKC